MKLKSFAAGAAAFLLGLSGSAAAQAQIPPPDAASGPALWQVADDDTTIYLFGTVHVLPRDIEWFDNRIQSAFESADELVFEVAVDDTAGMQQVIQQKAALEGEQTLRELMTEENRAQYEAALAGFGVPPETLDRVEPWMAAMTLSVLPLQTSGYSTQSGVEMSLDAGSGGKVKTSLETIEEQIGLFDTLPREVQLTFLDETVEAIPETTANIDRMVGEWLVGDADTLAELMNEEMDDPALYKLLLTDRNANWAEWIDRRMDRPGTVFIAVGAGHLAGRGSVQEMLEERGFDVTRIWE